MSSHSPVKNIINANYYTDILIWSKHTLIIQINTPVARIVDAAWNLCNVPSSIFNAITPWQLPDTKINDEL